MKICNLFFLLLILGGCDTKEKMFNGAFSGEFLSDRKIDKKTGKSEIFNQRLKIRDTIFVFKKGDNDIILTNLKTVYKNAKDGKEIIEGYDYAMKTTRSIRLIYVDWWNNPDSKTVIASALMIGQYQEKNDTTDIYYTHLR